MTGLRILPFVLVAIFWTAPAVAKKPAPLRTDRIQISYVPPKDPAHEPIYALLKERRALERFKVVFSPLRLRRDLLLKFEGCDGDANAWYDDYVITVCYEYLVDLIRGAPAQPTASGVTRLDAIMGPTVDTVLHEMGHALFHHHAIPIMGREEDAADQFAAYIWLQLADQQNVRRLLGGIAYTYDREASLPSPKKNPFADEHGLPAQRYYNVLCVAYGARPALFADLVTSGTLPKERAESCGDEYAQVKHAMEQLIRPYIDTAKANRVKAMRLLQFDAPH